MVDCNTNDATRGGPKRAAQAQRVASLGTPVGETMALNKNHSEGGGVIVNNTER